MARALLSIEVQDSAGNVQAGKTLSFLEVDGVTPLAQTIMNAPSGGSAATLVTNSLGLFEGYVTTPQRAKVSISGVTGLKNVSFDPDPSVVLVQSPGVMVNLDAGLTVVRNSAGVATAPALTLRDSNAAGYGIRVRDSGDTLNLFSVSAAAVAATIATTLTNSSAGTPTATLQNLNASGSALLVKDHSGSTMGAWNEQSLTLLGSGAKLGIGQSVTSSDPYSLVLAKTSPSSGWISVTATQDVTGTGNDEAVVRAVGRHLTTGNSAIRAYEAQVLKSVGSNAYVLWGHEVGVHQTIQDGYGVGLYIYGNNQQWIDAGAASKTGEAGVYVTGPNGWDYGFKYISTAGGVNFAVAGGRVSGDRAGDVRCAGDMYSTGFSTDRVGILDHRLAPAAQTWVGHHYDTTQVAWMIGGRSNGGAGYLPGLINPNGGALGVGVATTATINAATKLHVAGAIAGAQGTGATPTFHIVGDINTGLNSDGADTLKMITGGTVRLTFDANGNLAIGTAALATNATNGFLNIPTCPGTPTGAPTAFTGRAPIVYDSSAKKFWIYDGSWRGVLVA